MNKLTWNDIVFADESFIKLLFGNLPQQSIDKLNNNY